MKTLRYVSVSLYPFLCLILFLPEISQAQEELEMDEYIQEFFLGQTVFPQEKKEIQFTLKPSFTKKSEGLISIPFEMEYGFTDRLQIEIEIPYFISFPSGARTAKGFGNAEIGLMYSILKKNRPFSLSAGVSVPLHTAGQKFKEDDEVLVESFAVIGRQFGNVQVHGNVVTEFVKGDMLLNYGLSSVLNLGRCNATLEVSGAREDERVFFVSPGFIWKQSDGFEFGIAFSKSLTPSAREWGIVGIITREFSIARRKKDMTNQPSIPY
jgi:hypothetical protein